MCGLTSRSAYRQALILSYVYCCADCRGMIPVHPRNSLCSCCRILMFEEKEERPSDPPQKTVVELNIHWMLSENVCSF